jgi:ABC-2 type transport system permease protein
MRRKINISGIFAMTEKEMKDQFGSKRFLIIFGFTVLLSGLAAYQGVDFIKTTQGSSLTFLHIFTGTKFQFNILQIMVLFGPIIGMSLGFDSINKERTTGTLSMLLGQPIFRDTVINGKFLAGAASLATIAVGNILITTGLAIPLLGYGPSAAEVLRISIVAILTVLYLILWLCLGMLFSVIAKKPSTSILASIGAWMFFSILLGILASAVAGIFVPLPSGDFTGGKGEEDVKATEEWMTAYTERWEIEQRINQLSPTSQYENTAVSILGASTDFVTQKGEFTRTLSLGEAIVANWASLAFLVVGSVVCFALTYILFLRMEIRPGD